MNEKTGGSTPEQYGIPEGATELQDLIEYRDMNFAQGNIFKACYRLGTKNNDLYEMNKIYWFAKRERERIANCEPTYDSSDSINRLLENVSAVCLHSVSAPELQAIDGAIDSLIEARMKLAGGGE